MRISPLLELSSTALKIVVWLGSLGALLGAMGGLIDNDIKRIVALSTLSQLGYKVVAVGLSQYNLALFHLLMHAFFVRRNRYKKLFEGFSLREIIKRFKLTYLNLKFDIFWR